MGKLESNFNLGTIAVFRNVAGNVKEGLDDGVVHGTPIQKPSKHSDVATEADVDVMDFGIVLLAVDGVLTGNVVVPLLQVVLGGKQGATSDIGMISNKGDFDFLVQVLCIFNL